MRSDKPLVINVRRFKRLNGAMPSFCSFGQRHLEKEAGVSPTRYVGTVAEYTIPIEFLNMTVPPTILEGVCEVTLGYRRKV